MENSEQSEKIIDLGKLLVKELGLEPGVDTLGRWMAHYLAEMINRCEGLAPGKEKDEVEKECCEVILKIWDHRSQLPRGRRPFESFEPILKVLECINPDNEDPYLHRMSKHELTQLEQSSPSYKAVKPYLDCVLEIERVVRVWMENLLNQAAQKTTDEKMKAWLEVASKISLSSDVNSIRIVLKNFNIFEDDDGPLDKGDRLEMRIQQLEKFTKLNDILLKSYREELTTYKKEKTE